MRRHHRDANAAGRDERRIALHVIHGNNPGDPISLTRWAYESNCLLRYHGADGRIELAGRHIFIMHYPEYGHAMASTGNWDLVCCGHSHEAAVDRVANIKGVPRGS